MTTEGRKLELSINGLTDAQYTDLLAFIAEEVEAHGGTVGGGEAQANDALEQAERALLDACAWEHYAAERMKHASYETYEDLMEDVGNKAEKRADCAAAYCAALERQAP